MTHKGFVAVVTVVALALGAGCTRLKRWGYEGFWRDGWQKPEEVVAVLELRPENRVADLGAGGGYFTFRLAEAVGPQGKVYAVDVDEGMVEYIRDRAAKEGRTNIAPVLAEYDDPLIPEPGVDLIFTCNTYHHIQDRTAYFEQARRYLAPGGRIAIIDFKPHGWFQKIFPHSTSAASIRLEMEAAGYRLLREHDFLERQSFLVFAPAGG